MWRGTLLVAVVLLVGQSQIVFAQDPSDAELAAIRERLDRLNSAITQLKKGRDDLRPVADVELFAKAADWAIRHHEFFDLSYAKWTIDALETGLARATELAAGKTPWSPRAGSTVLGYVSRIDDSVQPYVVTFPRDYDSSAGKYWPLHVELHGRGDHLNEIRFIHQHEGRHLNEPLEWIQLDVFGRTNNAYRWAGETDVFEAMAALKRRANIDDRRITLRGFSMGGAGAWQIGLHYPSLWSSVGAGAGFVDTVRYLNLKSPLSGLHEKMIKIYDAQEYALNAFDVPIIGYGGELDAQLAAAQTMHEKGREAGLSIPLLVGAKTAHDWHPARRKEFMEFHAQHTTQGRPRFPAPSKLKFVTWTLKYNKCDWLTIEEQITPYERTVVEAGVDPDTSAVLVKTQNVSLLQIMRDVAQSAIIDNSDPLPLSQAAGNLLPGVYFEKRPEGWAVLDYQQSHKYASHDNVGDEPRKRHNLQGPIDDAFMEPFVCVRPTGTAWSAEQTEWAKWTLDRFENEFDHRLRGKVPVVKDTQVTEELLESKNLILFGDPGSNSMIAKLLAKLPIKWTRDRLEVAGQTYANAEHGIALIYPNPLNPRKYVVINSGHTFHEPEFRASNANLYPRLGDIAVVKFTSQPAGGFSESVVFADIFDAHWRLAEK